MPVIPEKHELEGHVHGSVAAQFWSQRVHSSKCVSGQSCTAACEPQPLPLCKPAGLSRTQFLIASQAVGLPVFPGFCGDHGGVVSSG